VPVAARQRESFVKTLLAWHRRHGRHDLPWQREPTPYRVWVSEIMLQQTQVATAIPYFQRFLNHFPDLESLAAGRIDEVLHHWSGLGYYARARNLHRTAGIIQQRHAGRMPEDLETLLGLPGIGRSTAGAILALACGQRQPILDGNVKRVLCRWAAIPGWPGQAAVQKRLWALADALTPERHCGEYTQAIMDLGASLCRRAQPVCGHCPVAATCRAFAQGRQGDYPASKPRRSIPLRQTRLALIRNVQGSVLLEQRPPSGLWGGLWSLPECPAGEEPSKWCQDYTGMSPSRITTGTTFRHRFTHFHLDITPLLLQVDQNAGPVPGVMDVSARVWYNSATGPVLGLPAPVSRLLQEPLMETPYDENGALCKTGP